MSDETYEGWSNRETWALNLHLANNEGDYRQMCEKAEELVAEHADEIDRGATACVSLMADYIKEWTEEVFEMVLHPEPVTEYQRLGDDPLEAARMFVSDVGSWWRADFYEIADGWIRDAIEAQA